MGESRARATSCLKPVTRYLTCGERASSADGEKVGKISVFYHDKETGEPEWFGVSTGLFGGKRLVVPVRGYSVSEDGVYVPYTSNRIQDAPEAEAEGVGPAREAELYEYYGLRRMPRPDPEPVAATAQPDESKEPKVGIRNVETGTVRLQKRVETQPVTAEVRVRRETASIERQELNEVVTTAEIGEREIELTLRHEEAFFEKQVLARERVTLSKGIEEHTERVVPEPELPPFAEERGVTSSAEVTHVYHP